MDGVKYITSNYPINYYTSMFNDIHAISNAHVYSLPKTENAVFLAYLG